MIRVSRIGSNPVPISVVHLPSGSHHTPPFNELQLFAKTDVDPFSNNFRAVSLDRLKYVLKNGVDVDPADQVLWVGFFDKAWEYGGWPKLIIALDHQSLCRSYKQVPSDTDAERIAAIQADYPTMVESTDGEKLWFSRLPEGDPRIATDYEIIHGRWIGPERLNPLRGIHIFTRPEDEEAVLKSLAKN